MSDLLVEKARAEAAKLRLEATVAEVKARLAPASLAEDAKDKGLRFARTKPAVTLAAGGAALALLLRRPLLRKLRRRRRKSAANTSSSQDGA